MNDKFPGNHLLHLLDRLALLHPLSQVLQEADQTALALFDELKFATFSLHLRPLLFKFESFPLQGHMRLRIETIILLNSSQVLQNRKV